MVRENLYRGNPDFRTGQYRSRVAIQHSGQASRPITDPHHAVIAITLSGENEDETEEIGSVAVNLVPVRLQERHYGVVLHPDQAKVLSRENIYGSGPPVEQPSPEALQLVLSNLPGRSSIVDVGCGAGAFGPGLIEAGLSGWVWK